jgi:hypothetical protein
VKKPANQGTPVHELFPYPRLRGYRFILPEHNRRHEQEYLDNRNALCRDEAFRRDILTLRQRYPLGYWEVYKTWEQKAVELTKKANEVCRSVSKLWYGANGTDPSVDKLTFTSPLISPSVSVDIDLLCSSWGLTHPQDKNWALWIIRNWNPAHNELPPAEPETARPWLDRWSLRIDNIRLQGQPSDIPFHATLTLVRGVSLRQAQAAVELAVNALNQKPSTGSRPRTSDRELEFLRAEFKNLGIPKPRKRSAMIRKVQEAYKRFYNRDLGKTFIGNQLRQWLSEQKQPVRRYVTESSGQNPKPS